MAQKSKNKSKKSKSKNPLGIGSRGKRKLTDEQVLAIVQRYRAGGITQKQLASEYPVSEAAISAIMCGRAYCWLTRIGLPELVPDVAMAA